MIRDENGDWGFDDRWKDYREVKGRPEGTIGLPHVLAALGADIRAAHAHAVEQKDSTLRITGCTVELEVVTTYDAEVDGKATFWVLEFDASGKYEHAATTHVTVTLATADDVNVGLTGAEPAAPPA